MRIVLALLLLAASITGLAQSTRQMEILAGQDQRVAPGAMLQPYVLRYTDGGQPLAGVRVRFPIECQYPKPGIACVALAPGESTERVSDANGIVTGPSYVANSVSGSTYMYAYGTLPGVVGPLFQAQLRAHVVAPDLSAAVELVKVSGDQQQVVPFGATSEPMTVRVLDAGGNPVPGAKVQFRAYCLELAVSNPPWPCVTSPREWITVISDANGFARSPAFRVNGYTGVQRIGAALLDSGFDSELPFRLDTVQDVRALGAMTSTGTGRVSLTVGGPATCSLLSLESLTSGQVPAAPSKVAFPHGFARATFTGCAAGTPLPLSLGHPGGLPQGARVWVSSPEWNPVETTADGAFEVAAGSGSSFQVVFGLGFGEADRLVVEDLWWAGAAENGWGLSVAQRGASLFNVIFAYDAQGQSTWYVMPGGSWDASGTTFAGAIYSPRGAHLATHDAGDLVVGDPAGRASIRFADPLGATLEMTIGTAVVTKTLTRQSFGPPQAAVEGPQRSGMWWAGASQNGWGLVLHQQYSMLFGVLFTYRADGSPTWFAMPSGYWSAADTYEGRVYATTGSRWPDAYDPNQLASRDAGWFKLRFGNGTATFDLRLDGASLQYDLVPQPF